MISKEQAIEIVRKFDFFQGQRAGRELWAEKPKAVQDEDIENFEKNCELLLDYICGVQPQRFWVIMDVPGFYDIMECEVDTLEYHRGRLTCITGYTVKHGNYMVISEHEIDRIAFFSKEAASNALTEIIKQRECKDFV